MKHQSLREYYNGVKADLLLEGYLKAYVLEKITLRCPLCKTLQDSFRETIYVSLSLFLR